MSTALFAALFFYICVSLYSRRLGLYILLLLLPTYIIRFSVAGYPSTWVEVMTVVTVVLFIVDCVRSAVLRKRMVDFVTGNKWLCVCAGVFLLGATISLFFTLNPLKAFDQWRGYYVWPVALMVVFAARFEKQEHWERAVDALVVSAAGVSVLAVYQHFTGWGIINPFWQAQASRRVTSIFGYPNGIGLYMSAVLPLIGGVLVWAVKKGVRGAFDATRIFVYIITLVVSLCAVWWARSTGALIALAAVVFFAALFERRARIVACVVGLAVCGTVVLAPVGSPLKQELLFKDLSGQIRLNMWRETFAFLKDHPVRGAGLFSYQQRMPPYHRMKVEIYQYPHNIFLNFWVDAGLVGLIGFLGVLAVSLGTLIKRRSFFAWIAVAGVIAMLVHGLVDAPLLRYDLAIIFWLTITCGLVRWSKT